MNIKTKLNGIIELFNKYIFEKEEIIKLSLLGLISGENIFLLGKPGVAKSLIAREICKLIDDGKYFEYLMNSFSTPEELFGPISLKKLDEDIYERKTDGYIPTSDVVFLDEIWKASPAIQNTLLTIINEKIYVNGGKKNIVPLKLLISASNELPVSNEGLEALFDRFTIRAIVNNINNEDNFEKMVSSPNINIFIPNELKFSINEINEMKEKINEIIIPKNIFYFIHSLRNQLNNKIKSDNFYVSDRRWKKIFWILKSLAFSSNRKQISLLDLLIIPNLIWSSIDEINQINNIFRDVFSNSILNFFSPILNKCLSDIESLQDQLQIKTSNVKFVKKMNSFVNENDNKIFYAEFVTTLEKTEKYFILPVSIQQDAWGINYQPYINSSQEKTYYYEKTNNIYIKKEYSNGYFLNDKNKSLYSFFGYQVKICEKEFLSMDENELINLNNKFLLSINEYKKISDISNIVNNEFDNFDSVLITNNFYEKEKLRNMVLSNINKIEKSFEYIEEQIKQITLNNQIIKENGK